MGTTNCAACVSMHTWTAYVT